MKNYISNSVRNSVAALAVLSLLALPVFSVKAADLYGGTYDFYDYTPSTYDYYDYSPSYTYDYYDYSPSYTYDYYDYSPSYSTYDYYDYTPSYTYDYYDYSPSESTYDYYDYTPSTYDYYDYSPSYTYDYYDYTPSYSYTPSTSYYRGGYASYGSYYSGGYSYSGGNYYGGCKKNCEPEKPKPAPWCDMWVSDNHVEKGDRVTLYWESDNVEDVRINKGIGRVDTEGSEKVRITENTTFVGTFEGKKGKEITCSATVSVDRDYVPPKHYPKTPYVTLNEVPYTGIDLGPVGNFVYWAFLIFWCLFGAYLIVVKRVQNNIYRSLKELLFGEEEKTVTVSYVTPIGKLEETVTFVPPASKENDDIDPFIASQINRS